MTAISPTNQVKIPSLPKVEQKLSDVKVREAQSADLIAKIKEAKYIEKEIELRQKNLDQWTITKLFTGVDDTEEKYLIEELAQRLVSLLKAIFVPFTALRQTKAFSAEEERALEFLGVRLAKAYQVAGTKEKAIQNRDEILEVVKKRNDADQPLTAQEKEAVDKLIKEANAVIAEVLKPLDVAVEAKLNAELMEESATYEKDLTEKLAEFKAWVKEPTHMSLLWLNPNAWTTASAKREIARMEVALAEFEAKKLLKNTPDHKKIQGGFELVIQKKESLLKLLKPDSLEYFKIKREIVQHREQIAKINAQVKDHDVKKNTQDKADLAKKKKDEALKEAAERRELAQAKAPPMASLLDRFLNFIGG